jgi:hypothetical protein
MGGEITTTSPAVSAASSQMQHEAVVRLIKQTLDQQQEALQQLLQAMGVGQNIDIVA